ncbi:MAG: glycosyltransferase family 2 protein, partial [Acidimicrobiales bacterium]
MSAPPTFSVIIPCVRGGSPLVEAVGSVLSQTCTDWELIIVDNGVAGGVDLPSTAGGSVRVLSEARPGASWARNRALHEARGLYAAFLDEDDRWLPGKLERQLAVLEGGTEAAHTQFEIIDWDGQLLGPGYGRPSAYRDLLVARDSYAFSSVAVSRDLVLAIGGFDTTYPAANDFQLMLRLLRWTEMSFVEETLVQYRVHAGSLSYGYWRQCRHALRALADERQTCRGEGEWGDWLRTWRGTAALRTGYSEVALHRASASWAAGSPGSEAARHLLSA